MNKIKHLRQEKGITQEELGKVLNVQKAAISKYELERATPSMDVLKRMATYFNVSIDYLLDYTPAAPTSPTDPHAASLPTTTPPALSPDEQDVLQKYRALPDGGKDTVKAVLNVQYNLTKPKSPDDKAM